MKKFKVGVLLMIAFSLEITAFAGSDSFWTRNKRAIAKANNQFAIALYSKLNRGGGNVFFSPFSVFNALSMVYAGARGQTEEEMAKVLHTICMPQDVFHKSFSELLKNMKNEKNGKYMLDIANALWIQKDFLLLENFETIMRDEYGGNFFYVNFSNSSQALKQINDWANEQTHGKIQKILNKIPLQTRLILTNAVYFKGTWASEFTTSDTRSSPFYVGSQETVKVPMMYQEAKFNYMENDEFQALEMPYAGENLSMVVLLPKEGYGINKLEKSLNASNLTRWLSEMHLQKIRVYFPKFKLESEYSLKEALSSMGMNNAFSTNANFSGIDGRKDLYISQVIQKAYVDVNEKGTEAAAVTAVIMPLTCSPNMPRVKVFRADHPFVFFIIDRSTQTVLFMGRIVNPS